MIRNNLPCMLNILDMNTCRSYKLYNHPAFTITLQLCIWGNLLLAVFEEPAVEGVALPYWVSTNEALTSSYSCDFQATMLIEGVFMLFILCRLIHNNSFSGSAQFWRDPKNLIVVTTIIVESIVFDCIESLPII